ncbi:MAG: hypothetical protein Q7T51_01850 [Candidatus Moranbacteria bacterium]|nr:hypothetical protein [Candidatus Moranbacteria bacterium]
MLKFLSQYESLANLITSTIAVSPFILLISFALWLYIKNRKDHILYEALVKHGFFLKLAFKLSLAILILFIVFFPNAWAPLLNFFTIFRNFFSLETYFFLAAYVAVITLAIGLITYVIRLYQIGRGTYQQTVKQLTRKSLYATFFIFIFLLLFSVFTYPQAFYPITDAVADGMFTVSQGRIALTKLSGEQLQANSSFFNLAKSAINKTSDNLSGALDSTRTDLSKTIASSKETLTQSITDTSKNLTESINGKVSSDGGEISGALTLSGSEGDLTVEGTTTTKDIIPNDNLSYNLGNSSKSWNTIYAHRLIGASPIFIGNNNSKHGLTQTGDLVISNDAEVQGTLHVETILIAGAYTLPTSDGSADQLIATDGNGNLSWTAKIIPGGTTGQLQWNDNGTFASDSELFWNNTDKRLGIGTNSPSTKLQVTGTVKADAFMLPGGIYLTSDSVSTNYWGETAGNIYRETGNIGMGTNTPTETLDINGRVHLRQTTAPVDTVDKLYNVAGDVYWNGLKLGENFWTKTGSDVAYNLAGNVGIGITPTTKLEVAGTVRATNFYDATNGAYLTPGSVNANWWGESGGNIYRETGDVAIGSNDANGYRLHVDGNVYGTGSLDLAGNLNVNSGKLFVDATTGNVGVGTVSPGYPLQVTGNIRSSGSVWSDTNIRANGILTQSNGANFTLNTLTTGAIIFSPGTTEAMRIISGGNVGIGTTAPNQKLEVNGNLRFSDTSQFFEWTNGTKVYFDNFYSAAADYSWKSWNGSSVINNMLIKASNGNVGIGTTAPVSSLQIGSVGSTGYASQKIAWGDGTRAGSINITSAGSFLYSSVGQIFAPGSSEKMRITPEGNVGIGTTSPGSPLSVAGSFSGANTIMIATNNVTSAGSIGIMQGLTPNISNGGNAYMVLGKEASANNRGGVAYNHVSDGSASNYINIGSFYGATAGSGINVLANGNVGIGTVSPSTSLHLVSDSGIRVSATQSGDQYISIKGGPTSRIESFYGLTLRAIGGYGAGGTYPITFSTGNTSEVERMRIANNGNVGIGTTNPLAKFSVGDASYSYARILDTSSGSGYGGLDLYRQATLITHLETNGVSYIKKYDNSGTVFAVDNINGNVGIGTTNPGAKLNVKSGGTDAWGFLVNSSDSQRLAGIYEESDTRATFAFYNATDSQTIRLDTGGNSYFNGGNVGIGTTAPGSKLHIAGGDFQIGPVGGSQIYLRGITGGDLSFNRNPSTGVISNASAFSYQLHRTESTTAESDYLGWQVYNPAGAGVTTSALVINGNGNVGIGTTSPVSQFQIDGVSAGIRLRRNAGNEPFILLTNTTETSGGQIRGLDGAYGLRFTDPFSAEYMRINSSGNVGIGTSAPGAKLDVNGTTLTSKLSSWGSTYTSGGNYLFTNSFGGATIEQTPPMNDYIGNQLMFADAKGFAITSSGSISSVSSAFRQGDTYATITNTTLPIVVEVTGSIPSDTDVGSQRVFLQAHGNISGHLLVEIKKFDDTWVTLADEDISIASKAYWFSQPVTNVAPYPAAWAIKGVRYSITSLTEATTYIRQLGWYKKNGFIYPFLSEYNPSAYGNLTFNQTGNHDITASSGTLRLGTHTLLGAVTGNAQSITGLGQLTVDNLRIDGNTIDATSGAITISPTAGSNLNIGLSGAGDFAVNTNQLYVDTSAGNVGIGTTSPTYNLHVVGNAFVSTVMNQNQLSVGAIGGLSGVRAYVLTASDTVKGLVIRANSATQSANLQEWQDSVGNVLSVVDKNGNIGIGTVTPTAKLDVVGQAIASDGFIQKTNAGACTDALFTTDTDGQICLDSTAGVERMYFRTGGAWSYIAKTGGFQIPNYEVAPLNQLSQSTLKGVTPNELTHFQNYLTQQITPGELLIPYADSTLQDGAIHGLYARFADVKNQMFQEEKTQIENLNLQVTGNITTVAELKNSINTQLGSIEKSLSEITNNQDTITKQISNINTQITNDEIRIATLENLATTLQAQITTLQSQIATPVNIAQIDANTQSIDYLNQLLGITPTSKVGDITIVGKLTSQITETGLLTIAVNDKTAATIGEAIIKAGDTSVKVDTTAISADSKVFVTSEKPVEIGVNTIQKGASFKIEIGKVLLEDLQINWWIVDKK